MRRNIRRLILVAATVVFVAAALGVWALTAAASLPPAGPALPPIAGLVYETRPQGINLWDAASGAAQPLVPAGSDPRLLDARADGSAVAYLDAAPPVSPTDSLSGGYALRVWRSDGPVETVPLPEGASPSLSAQFLDGGGLAVLLHANAARPGPLYLYDPDAGRLQRVAAAIDGYAAGGGLLAYAAPLQPTSRDLSPRQIALFDPGAGGPATAVVTFTVADVPRPVHLYYEPAHGVFFYTARRPSGDNGRNAQVELGTFAAATPGAITKLPLAENSGDVGLALSADGRYVIYGAAVIGSAAADMRTRQAALRRLLTLNWTGSTPAVARDQALSLPGDLQPERAAFVPGRDLLALGAWHTRERVAGDPSLRDPTTPAFILADPGGGRTETVLDGLDGTLLAALDGRRLLLATQTLTGLAQGPAQSTPSLALAERSLTGWQTRVLGAPLGAGSRPVFAGLLPGGAALVYVDNVGPASGPPEFMRVPLDGGARTVVGDLTPRAAYVPLAGP